MVVWRDPFHFFKSQVTTIPEEKAGATWPDGSHEEAKPRAETEVETEQKNIPGEN